MGHEKVKVAVLGPLGTYTHEAAFQAFGHSATFDERKSIADVFAVLSSGVPLGVVPQENSIFGNVIETYDLLRASDPTFIRGEITLKVQHCLVVRKGVKIDQIKRIMSHEQALGQCRSFIAEHLPMAYAVKTTSTAAAAQALLENPPDCAAICSSICATLLEGLEVLHSGIQDEKSNYTRFYIISYCRSMTVPPILELEDDCQMKALVRLTAPSPSSGSPERCESASHDIMQYLRVLDLHASRIDRRPSLEAIPFHNLYFVEVVGDRQQERALNSELWSTEVEKAIERVKSAGGIINLVGLW